MKIEKGLCFDIKRTLSILNHVPLRKNTPFIRLSRLGNLTVKSYLMVFTVFVWYTFNVNFGKSII